jgi:hypothetical protein
MMCRTTVLALAGLALLLSVPAPGPACSLCGMNIQQASTIRLEAAGPSARIVAIGTVQDRDKRLAISELHITQLLRTDPFLGDRKVIELPKYVPVNPNKPPVFLVFCDVFKDKLDPFRGIPLRSADAGDYVKKVMALDSRDIAANLPFYFGYLEHSDPEVAKDAFLEFAKAGDRDIARAAPRLDPAKLRSWLDNERTPPERLSVYAVLLGACGREQDADYLKGLLDKSSERTVNAYDGILAGYMHLRPRDGWALALATLRDERKQYAMRLAVVRSLRFWHGAKPQETRENVLQCLAVMLGQADMADLAVEDLRRWQMWNLTRDVLSVFGKKGYDAPLMQQAIVRYALSCKDAACTSFLDERRRTDPELVRDVEEQLRQEK